jgi:hypothetical protein
MAAHIHNYVGLPNESGLTGYLDTLPTEALPFLRRSAEWRDDFCYQCHTRIRMRLQHGHLPLPNCYGENFILGNIHYDTDEDGADPDDGEHDSEIKMMPPCSLKASPFFQTMEIST